MEVQAGLGTRCFQHTFLSDWCRRLTERMPFLEQLQHLLPLEPALSRRLRQAFLQTFHRFIEVSGLSMGGGEGGEPILVARAG